MILGVNASNQLYIKIGKGSPITLSSRPLHTRTLYFIGVSHKYINRILNYCVGINSDIYIGNHEFQHEDNAAIQLGCLRNKTNGKNAPLYGSMDMFVIGSGYTTDFSSLRGYATPLITKNEYDELGLPKRRQIIQNNEVRIDTIYSAQMVSGGKYTGLISAETQMYKDRTLGMARHYWTVFK